MSFFFKKNIVILNLQYLFFIGLWSYATLAPLILTKHFNFSTITISFFQNLCILGFALGFAFANIALNARKSYLHYLEKAIILLPILMLMDFIVLKYNLNSNILLISRFLEGIFCGIFLSTISFLIKLELIDYEKMEK